jgi:hypothetical protein
MFAYTNNNNNNNNHNQYVSQQQQQQQHQPMVNFYDQQQFNLPHHTNHPLNNYYNYFNNNNNNKYYNYETIDQNNIITTTTTTTIPSTNNNANQWYSCSNLSIPKKNSPYINGSSDGRSSSAFDSCDSLNTISINDKKNTQILYMKPKNSNSIILNNNNNNKRFSNMQQTTAVPTNSFNHHTAPVKLPKLRPRTITIADLHSDRSHWGTPSSRRNTPIMNTSPKSALSSSSSSTTTTTSTTTTSSISSVESDTFRNSVIIAPAFKPGFRNRHSLLSDLGLSNQKTENSNTSANLMRKTSLPPDKTIKVYNGEILNQKAYSNLYPEVYDRQVKKQISQIQYRTLQPNLSAKSSFKVVKNEESTSPSISPENLQFQRADFTPQLLKLNNNSKLGRKQSYNQSPLNEISGITVLAAASPKNFDDQHVTSGAGPNVSTLRKFFKDNNPFGKFNSQKQRLESGVDSNSNSIKSDVDVVSSSEQFDKKRKYKTLTHERKKVSFSNKTAQILYWLQFGSFLGCFFSFVRFKLNRNVLLYAITNRYIRRISICKKYSCLFL